MEEKGKGKGCSPGHTEVGNDARAAGDEEDVIDEIGKMWFGLPFYSACATIFLHPHS